MKVLVTGSNGQLGSELQLLSRELPGIEFLFTDLDELDITDRASVENTFSVFKPSWLINCAAYTGVDKAEQEPDKAMLLNAFAPGLLAEIASKQNTRLIHISTDYVFNGKSNKPYCEEDTIGPLDSVYAKSKADGEKNVISKCPSAIVIRTSWLYSAYGNNFVKTIRRVGLEHGELKVVADQVGSPTWAHDLAEAIMNLIELNAEPAVFHFANEGICSWYDFAKAIVELSGIECIVNPTDTVSYPLPSPRPFYSVLDKSKYKAYTRKSIPYWRDSLKKCIALLNEQK